MQRAANTEKGALRSAFRPKRSRFRTRSVGVPETKQEGQAGLCWPISSHNFMEMPIYPAIQTKLIIGTANDKYEQEADRVAGQVMNSNILQRQDDEELLMNPSGSCMQCESSEDEKIQTMPSDLHSANQHNEAPSFLQSAIEKSCSGGRHMSEEIRTPMERALGYDFSGVRIHTTPHSHRINNIIQSRAFTIGQNIFLGQGENNLRSRQGSALIAHELTHVVQQNGNRLQRAKHYLSSGSTSPSIPVLPRQLLRAQNDYGVSEGLIQRNCPICHRRDCNNFSKCGGLGRSHSKKTRGRIISHQSGKGREENPRISKAKDRGRGRKLVEQIANARRNRGEDE